MDPFPPSSSRLVQWLRLACPLSMPGLTVRYLRTSETKTRGHLHKLPHKKTRFRDADKKHEERKQEEESRARLTITVKSSPVLPEIRLARPMQLEDGAHFVRLAPAKTSATVSKCGSLHRVALVCCVTCVMEMPQTNKQTQNTCALRRLSGQ